MSIEKKIEVLRGVDRQLHDLCEARAEWLQSSCGSGDCRYLFPDGRVFYWNEFALIGYKGKTAGFFIVPAKDNGCGYGAEENRVHATTFLQQVLSYPGKGKQLSLFA